MSETQHNATLPGQAAVDFLTNLTQVSYADWKKDVVKALEGAPFEKKLVTRTHEGVDLEPLYTPTHPGAVPSPGLPGAPPFTRHHLRLGHVREGWEIRQTYDTASVEAGAGEILDDVSAGATGVHVKVHAALRAGYDVDEAAARPLVGVGGAVLSTVDDLRRLLVGVDLAKTSVALDCGGNPVPVAAALVQVAGERGVPAKQLHGTLCADPIGALARDGRLPASLERSLAVVADLAAWTTENAPNLRAALVSTGPYHEAGASAVDELAFAVATGLQYLRAMVAGGLTVDQAAQQIAFDVSVASDIFTGIAKLRVIRKLWAGVVATLGGSVASQGAVVHARGSERALTRHDPWVNLLRGTVECFAAAVGGADSVSVPPFDAAIGPSDATALRLARNTQIILRDEASLHRVIDPGGGSFFLENLTETLAQSAWTQFQAIEKASGMAKAFTGGAVAGLVGATAKNRKKAVATRRDPITGVSEYANVAETPIVREPENLERLLAIGAASVAEQRRRHGQASSVPASAPLGQLTASAIADVARGVTFGALSRALAAGTTPEVATPLAVARNAKAFEDLRDASDEHLQKTGSRPTVFLANIGPIPQHKPRATFSGHFFAAGGFAVVENNGFATPDAAADAFSASKASVAVICSTDAVYPEVVPALARLLKEKGARVVVLAGRPGDHEASFKQAGVDDFIFMGCDVVATLRTILANISVSH